MADSKQIIELEVKLVQEQLVKLFEERKKLQKEFEELTGSSHQLLLEIKEDPTSASERKLHNYEAEKRRIEEKLEVLENEISEKDKRITLLDSKAGQFLQQVSTTPTSNNLSNTDDKEEVDIIGDECTSAVTVGEGGKSVEGARDGAHEVEVKCSDSIDVEVNQSVVDSHQATSEQDHEVQECNHSDTVDTDKIEYHNGKPEVNEFSPPEELHKNIDDVATTGEMPESADSEAGEVSGTEDSEPTEGEEKFEGQENHVTDNTKFEMKTIVSAANNQSCLGDTDVEEEKDKASTHVPLGNGVSDKLEGLNESEVQSHTEIGEATKGSQETQLTTCNEPIDTVAGSSGPVAGDSGAQSLKEVTPAVAEGDSAGKQISDSNTPVQEQVTSLSMLVAELRRVKDDMGKCMTVKEHSFLDLEDQLQAANKEAASLKASMALLYKDLEEKKQGYQALEEENKKKKMDIDSKFGEIQEVTNKCTMLNEEKVDLLRKMEVLEIMMTEYRTEIEMLVGEKNQMEQQTKQLLAAKTAASTAEAEIDSRTSVEEKEKEIEELVEKIQSMEKEMKELNDKLKVTNRHLKVMAREREYKQRECEILKHKVEMVELKMCELQGTFDMLIKAVMVERDDLIKEMDVKNNLIDDLQQTVVRLKDTHEQEIENVLYEKKLSDEELLKYKSGEIKSPELERKELEEITKQKECLELKLKEKTDEAENLDKKVKTIHDDMTDFVNSLKDEMARIKDDSQKLQQEKANLSETFSSLQGEHKELQSRHQTMEKSFEELDKSNREKSVTMESLKIQLEDIQKQTENVNTKNFTLTAEMFKKEEESREELSAREATIQELTVTLTNNQKQSMENYHALQQDMNSLQTKFKTSTEEHKKHQKELEERLKGLEKEKTKEVNNLQEEIKYLKTELSDKNRKLQATEPSKSSKDTKGQKTKDKEIETLNKKVEELTQALESAKGASKGKEDEAKHESGSEASKNQEEFEASIDTKEKKIVLLESKVSDLEMCLANKSGYITQLEDRIKESPEIPNNAEAHLEQINKLSADISKLKEELKQTYEECKSLKNTVNQLENDKKSIEDEKAKIMEEYENKLQQANGNVEGANAQLEQKKNSVERLELELRTSSDRYLEEVANLESNQIGRIANLVKLHRQKVEVLKAGNAAKVSELLVHIDKLNEEKIILENELKNLTLEQSDSSLSTLIQERDSLITKVTNLEHSCELLEKDKLRIEEEKKTLKNSFKEEQIMTMEMQSQMVADSEKLILDLEINNSSLKKQIEAMQSICEQHSLSILQNEKKVACFEHQNTLLTIQKDKYMEENRKLKTVIEETISRINIDAVQPERTEIQASKHKHSEGSLMTSQAFLDEQKKVCADKLKEERDSQLMQPKVLKKCFSEGGENSEYDKKKAVLEYEDKISSLIADYQEQISSLTTKFESKQVEEKAEFGRVLVAKIDNYEKQIASQDEEINGLRTEITKLQMDICDKVKIIEELEANLDDMTLMRASLRAQVDDLKLAITKANTNTSDQSCLDILHTEYETRINEIQDYYEAQLNTLRSCLPETDIELQAVTCGSPSQDSEYSIELSCLRPFLQDQSPVEQRSQSAEESHFSVCSEAWNLASSGVHYHLAKSSSDVINTHEAQSCLTSDGKTETSTPSLHSHIKRKPILKAKTKCKSNGSIRHIVLDSASRSELRILKSSLRSREEQNPQKMYQTLARPYFTEETTAITTSILQSFKPFTSLQQIQIQASTEQYPPPGTADQASAILSAMGAIPKPPCHAVEFKADCNKEAPPAPGSSTTTALSSTTHHSDLDPNNTALDKYRIKVMLSACCIPSAVIADWGWDSDSETSAKPSLPFFGDFRQLTILIH